MNFQAVVVSDTSDNRTFAIFTYNCDSPNVETYMNFPDEISGTIGIHIPGINLLQRFRYSDTPYAVEVRCLNIGANDTFVNLVYDLNPQPKGETESHWKYILAMFQFHVVITEFTNRCVCVCVFVCVCDCLSVL